jgi:hypothetical protein
MDLTRRGSHLGHAKSMEVLTTCDRYYKTICSVELDVIVDFEDDRVIQKISQRCDLQWGLVINVHSQ